MYSIWTCTYKKVYNTYVNFMLISDTLIKLFISTQGLDEEKQQTVHAMLAILAQTYVESHNLSTAELEPVGALIKFLEKAYHVALVSVNEGSLEIVVRCPNLESLEHLWGDYLSGRLNEETERHLMTDEVKRKLNMETVRLKTTIEEGNYLMCRKAFMEMSGTFE